MLDPATLERLRHDYVDSLLTIRQLCRKYDVSEYTLTKLRKANDWPARSNNIKDVQARRLGARIAAGLPEAVFDACMAAALDDDDPPSDGTAPETKARTPTKRVGASMHRKTLMQRLYLVFEAKLSALEARSPDDTTLDADIRSFGLLIKQFVQLTDMSNAADKSARANASVADTTRDDKERLRQDLVERFHKLRQSHADQPAAV